MQKIAMKNRAEGFSLIELLVALAILLVVTAFVVSAFTNSIKTVRRDNALADRDADVKRALELMTIEIGQAGVTPEMIDVTNNTTLAANSLAAGTTITSVATKNVQLNNAVSAANGVRGLYPGRPLVLGLPEGSANSEKLPIAYVDNVNSSCGTSPCVQMATAPAKSHAAPDNYITSPMLPLMFGVLNPPPATIPTTLEKQIQPEMSPSPTPEAIRLGIVGDILSNGALQYVEYTFWRGKLYRSLTPINQPNSTAKKSTAYVILDNVESVDFRLIYPDTSTPIPVAVKITINALSSVPEPVNPGQRTGTFVQQLFKKVVATAEIVPRGTYASALIFGSSGENQLREMLPPCKPGGTLGVGFPPCTVWRDDALWKLTDWNNVFNFARKPFNDDVTTGAPAMDDNLL